jgi:DNA-binding GntR family transcriptional regulator
MALLEGRCAALAIERLTEGGLLEVRALHQTLEQAAARQDLMAYYAANHVFHTRVQDLSGNRWLIRATEDVRKFVRLLRGRQLVVPGRLDASIGEHRELLRAFEARDAAAAERVMQGHLRAQCRAWQTLQASATTQAEPEDSAAHV